MEFVKLCNFFMKSLLVSLSLLSKRSSNFSIDTWLAIFFIKLWFKQFISIGSRTTSWRFSITKSTHSWTKTFIYKKSLDIRIEITFFISNAGPLVSYGDSESFYFKYFISHSNILISQCTLMSISSTEVASVKYFSKYFIWVTRRSFSHVKSLLTFLFSSNTWITIISCYFLFWFNVVVVVFYEPSPPPAP